MGPYILQLNYLSGLPLWQMASVSSNVIFVSTSESLTATPWQSLSADCFIVLADFIPQPAVNWWTVWVFSSVCLLSHCLCGLFSFSLSLSKALSTGPSSIPFPVPHSPFLYLPCAPCLSLFRLLLSHSHCLYAIRLPLLSTSPSSPVFSLSLSPLYRHVFAPDAGCLSSVGRVSVMGPSRNSKHHSGIFFQAIAFCSNKGGVALASLWMGLLALGKTSTSAHLWILSRP